MGNGDDGGGGDEGSEDVFTSRVEPMLVSLLDLYSDDDRILSR